MSDLGFHTSLNQAGIWDMDGWNPTVPTLHLEPLKPDEYLECVTLVYFMELKSDNGRVP
jgi:hypothetical protein